MAPLVFLPTFCRVAPTPWTLWTPWTSWASGTFKLEVRSVQDVQSELLGTDISEWRPCWKYGFSIMRPSRKSMMPRGAPWSYFHIFCNGAGARRSTDQIWCCTSCILTNGLTQIVCSFFQETNERHDDCDVIMNPLLVAVMRARVSIN